MQTSNQEISNCIAVWLSEGSGWTVESVDEQYINIVKYIYRTNASDGVIFDI